MLPLEKRATLKDPFLISSLVSKRAKLMKNASLMSSDGSSSISPSLSKSLIFPDISRLVNNKAI